MKGRNDPGVEAGMLVDAHCHMDGYGERLDAAIRQIQEQRILTISASMDPSSYRANLEIGRRCDLVLPIFGIHPWRAHLWSDRLDELEGDIRRCPMIGEVGLDYHWVEDPSAYPAQQKVFEHFLATASDLGKTVNLHTKGAEARVLELLDQYQIRRAIVHWYSGPMDILEELAKRGLYFTVGPEILYSAHIKAIARALPQERILTETDNPGGHQWLSGTPGMPSILNDVVRALARARGTSPEDIEQAVWDNFLRLVREDPWLSESLQGSLGGIQEAHAARPRDKAPERSCLP